MCEGASMKKYESMKSNRNGSPIVAVEFAKFTLVTLTLVSKEIKLTEVNSL